MTAVGLPATKQQALYFTNRDKYSFGQNWGVEQIWYRA